MQSDEVWGHCKSMITQIRDVPTQPLMQTSTNPSKLASVRVSHAKFALQIILPDEAELSTLNNDGLVQPKVQSLLGFSKLKMTSACIASYSDLSASRQKVEAQD